MINKSFEFKIGVIGLGYVGTPLACLFSKDLFIIYYIVYVL